MTIEELNAKCKIIYDADNEVDLLKKKIKSIESSVEFVREEVQQFLMDNSMKSYRSPYGLATNVVTRTIPIPQNEDRARFFAYLRENNLEDMISVNSTTLNGWYRQRKAEEIAAGNADWLPPGLSGEVIKVKLKFT